MHYAKLVLLTVTAIALGGAMAVKSQAAASKTTENFIENAVISSEFEIQSSKVALDKSQDQIIKSFAQKMIDDHTQTNDQLQSLIRSSSSIELSAVPSQLDAKHQKLLDELKNTATSDFDRTYFNMQVNAHQEAISLFRDYAKHGDNANLKAFAAQTLPTLEQHQDHLKRIKR